MDERALVSEQEREADEVGKPRAARIDPITRLCVIRAHQAQPALSCAELGTHYGLSESSVRRILAVQTIGRKDTVEALMLTEAVDVVEAWRTAVDIAAAKGFYQGAEAWLQACGAIEAKPQVQAAVSVRPTVTLSMNFGLGALQPAPAQLHAAIEAQAVPALPPQDDPDDQ